MGTTFSCLGLCEKAYSKDLPRPERYSSVEFEKSGVSIDEKKSFTVLVTGMGVSKGIPIFILLTLLPYSRKFLYI
jgi:hypothetical protein